ncbi:ABC transporter ATP-binding protein [Actinomadura terrae]|uniref:ABC transporter ATP-binding protein n=1 Tax=Actinomadura terrae TaxID=604353 RepID=UPI001FA6EB02|nr:ABC transporter ATP-binding protein [Actinomadura terrae]
MAESSSTESSSTESSSTESSSTERRPASTGGPRFRGGPAAFVQGPTLDRSRDALATARRLLALIRRERSLLAVSVALTLASVALLLFGPRVLGHATDLIFAGVVGHRPIDFDAVGRTLVLALGLYGAATALLLLQARVVAAIVQRAMFRLRAQVQHKLSVLPLGYLDGRPKGELLSRTTNDIDNVGQSVQQTFSIMLNAVLTFFAVLSMMFVISPLLAAVALTTLPLTVLATRQIAKRSKPLFLDQWGTTGRLNGHIEEMFTGHVLVRVFGRQDEAARTFEEHNNGLYESSSRAQFISGLARPAMMFLGNVNYLLVAVVGGLRVASGAVSLGDVQAFVQYSQQLGQSVSQATGMLGLVQSGLASAERVLDLLDAEEQGPDPAEPRSPRQVRGRVEFEHVSFSYDPGTPLIEDLSLAVAPGQTAAIVGPTGAGKTTLVNLLMRFYEVSGGRITLDGVDIAGMTRADLRSRTGMVLQDSWLFGGTIAENIAYGRAGATREQIVAAARATHVDHFVRTLPDGYDTVLDEEGAGLSSGERQLITIARAFIAEPAILILDEATSSVDTRTELLVQRAMSTLRAGRTSFVIAHRLSTVREADLILVMEDGRIVEQGTHAGLLASGGAYAALYESQFSGALTADTEP